MNQLRPEVIREREMDRLAKRVFAYATDGSIDVYSAEAFKKATDDQLGFIVRHQDTFSERFGEGVQSVTAGLIAASEGSSNRLVESADTLAEYVNSHESEGSFVRVRAINEEDDFVDRLHFKEFGTVPRSHINRIKDNALLGEHLSFITQDENNEGAFGYALAYLHPYLHREDDDVQTLRAVWVEAIASESSMGPKTMAELMTRAELLEADIVHFRAAEKMASFMSSPRLQGYVESQYGYMVEIDERKTSDSIFKKHIAPHVTLRRKAEESYGQT